jgi:sugar-specific transcriptional regulator TrmB
MPSPTFPSPLSPSLRPLLKRLGLNERETEVYLALLPMKIGRATDIAKAAKQSRSHAYLVLRSLQEKGLVSEIERGKVLHFVAESPQKLLAFLQDREEEIKSLKPLVEGALPYLKSLTSTLIDRPRVTMLSGMDGMKQVYRETLPNEFCALFNPEAMYRAFGRNIVTMLFGEGAALHGRDLLPDNEFSHRYMREVQQTDTYQIRLMPASVTFDTDTIVCGDIIALFSYDDEKTIVRIENRNLANSMRAWFEVLWAQGKPA